MMAIAKAHAWMFPGKRIKVGKRTIKEAREFDYVAHLDRLIKKHGVSHPAVRIALKTAAHHADKLAPHQMAILKRHLGNVVDSEVDSDMRRPGSWRQTASVDFNLKRALIEGLRVVRARG